MSAPSGPIQVIPRGLLGMLQLKNLGRLPDTLQGTVQPTVDINAYWVAALAESDTQAHTQTLGAGVGGIASFLVPIGTSQEECAWVQEYTVEVVCGVGAGEFADAVSPILLLNNLAPFQWVGLTDTQIRVQGTAAAGNKGIITARNFWMPPNALLGFYVGQIASAATVTFNGQAYLTRMAV